MVKARMIHTLAEAQASRKSTSSGSGSGSSGMRQGGTSSRGSGSVTLTETEAQTRASEPVNQRHKVKVLKKPPQAVRNFGGGKLGGGNKQNDV